MNNDNKKDKPAKVPEKVAETAEEKKERLLKAIALRKQKSKYLTASDWQEFLNSTVSGYEHLPKGHHLYATLTAGCGPKAKKPKLAPAASKSAPPPPAPPSKAKVPLQPPVITVSPPTDNESTVKRLVKKKVDPQKLTVPTVKKNLPRTSSHMGIKNRFYDCYAIASLNCLFSMPSFSMQILNMTSSRQDETAETLKALKYLGDCCMGNTVASDPTLQNHSQIIFKNLAETQFHLARNTEHDATEYITLLIHYLKGQFDVRFDNLFKFELLAEAISCLTCKREVARQKDCHLIYSVVPCVSETNNVQDLITRSLKEKVQMNCCKSQQIARVSKITKTPKILMVRIDRFGKSKDGELEKLKVPVVISKSIVLDQFDNPDDESSISKQTYELQGVILHWGESVSHGHYFCYLKDHLENKWLRVNNHRVHLLRSLDQALAAEDAQQNCYLIIYVQK